MRDLTRERCPEKRVFDVIVSACALVVLSPLVLAGALAIWLEDRKWPFYAAKRVGEGGDTFTMWKLRTMDPDADKSGIHSTSADDPRITRVGRVLRKLKVDEFPQFLNVLCGDMSLVGPRPEVRSEVDDYAGPEQILLSVKPGFLDYATIVFSDEAELLRGAEDANKRYRELIRPWKSRMACHYIMNWTLWIDIALTLAMHIDLISRQAALGMVAQLLERTGASKELAYAARRKQNIERIPVPDWSAIGGDFG